MKRDKLVAIQALRAIAAIAVVMHHASGQLINNAGHTPWGSLNRLGDHGVDLFFAISGFIIFYAHFHELNVPSRALVFVRKRLLRILPATFVVATGWALIALAASKAGIHGPEIDLATWVSSAFVLPMIDQPSPVVIWTLRNEFVFYGIFCLLLVNLRAGGVLFALWIAACAVISVPGHLNAVTEGIFVATLFSDLNLIFAFGMGAFWLFRHYPAPMMRHLFWPLGLLFCAMVVYDHVVAELPTVLFGLSAGLLVYAASQFRQVTFFGGTLQFLGDASFSIYLAHMPFLAVAYPFLARLDLPVTAGYFLMSAAGVGIGVLFYIVFERPITRRFGKGSRALA